MGAQGCQEPQSLCDIDLLGIRFGDACFVCFNCRAHRRLRRGVPLHQPAGLRRVVRNELQLRSTVLPSILLSVRLSKPLAVSKSIAISKSISESISKSTSESISESESVTRTAAQRRNPWRLFCELGAVSQSAIHVRGLQRRGNCWENGSHLLWLCVLLSTFWDISHALLGILPVWIVH